MVWVGSNPPTFKKGTHEIFRKSEEFLGVEEGGLREKKHELCQIVLNKQQHLHDAIIAFQLRSLIYCSDHCRF